MRPDWDYELRISHSAATPMHIAVFQLADANGPGRRLMDVDKWRLLPATQHARGVSFPVPAPAAVRIEVAPSGIRPAHVPMGEAGEFHVALDVLLWGLPLHSIDMAAAALVLCALAWWLSGVLARVRW